jgi:integrase
LISLFLAFWRILAHVHRMAKQSKKQAFVNCKLKESKSTATRTPWRVWFTIEQDGQPKRVFKSFADEGAARSFATAKELEISNHGIRYGDIPPEVRRAFDHYRDKAAELRADGGEVPPFEKLIADSLSAIRADLERVAASVVTVAEGVEEFLAYKATRVGDRHAADLKAHLKRFAADYGDRAFQSVTTAELEKWLSELRSRLHGNTVSDAPLLGPLARNHHRTSLRTLFGYAAAKGRAWCAHNPLIDLDPEKVKTGEPLAYAPEAAQRIMQAALDHKPELLPVLALGFFAGLRSSEAAGMDLGRLDFASDEFKLPPGRKTGSRSCPFLPSCKAWLEAQPRRQGPAWIIPPATIRSNKTAPSYGLDAAMRELFELAGVEKINNGARHSFISYRCAETRDVAQVADEAGNSVAMVKKHYRNITTAAVAKKFFAIRPTTAENVASINEGRKSA